MKSQITLACCIVIIGICFTAWGTYYAVDTTEFNDTLAITECYVDSVESTPYECCFGGNLCSTAYICNINITYAPENSATNITTPLCNFVRPCCSVCYDRSCVSNCERISGWHELDYDTCQELSYSVKCPEQGTFIPCLYNKKSPAYVSPLYNLSYPSYYWIILPSVFGMVFVLPPIIWILCSCWRKYIRHRDSLDPYNSDSDSDLSDSERATRPLSSSAINYGSNQKRTIVLSNTTVIVPEVVDEVVIINEDSPLDAETVICKVCMEKRVRVMASPCHHAVYCGSCAQQLASASNKPLCSVCRTPIQEFQQIYL